MNASMILMILQGVKLLQEIKNNHDVPVAEKTKVMGQLLKGSDDEIAAVGKAMQDIDPDFLADVCDGVGDFVKRLLGHK